MSERQKGLNLRAFIQPFYEGTIMTDDIKPEITLQIMSKLLKNYSLEKNQKNQLEAIVDMFNFLKKEIKYNGDKLVSAYTVLGDIKKQNFAVEEVHKQIRSTNNIVSSLQTSIAEQITKASKTKEISNTLLENVTTRLDKLESTIGDIYALLRGQIVATPVKEDKKKTTATKAEEKVVTKAEEKVVTKAEEKAAEIVSSSADSIYNKWLKVRESVDQEDEESLLDLVGSMMSDENLKEKKITTIESFFSLIEDDCVESSKAELALCQSTILDMAEDNKDKKEGKGQSILVE